MGGVALGNGAGVALPTDPARWHGVRGLLVDRLVDGTRRATNANEGPWFYANITQEYNIETTEVTNILYLNYLKAAIAEQQALYDQAAQVIRYYDSVPPVDTTWVFLQLDPALTLIQYDLDHRTFIIRSGVDSTEFYDHPVTGVTWRGASAYAVFYGLRLPTEAEWEIAAKGTHTDWGYPFGVDLPAAHATEYVNFSGTSPAGTRLVTSYERGRSPFGLYNMAGNVAEWVNDWFGPYPVRVPDPLHPHDPSPPVVLTDPQGALDGIYKVVRGGTYQDIRIALRSTARSGQKELETSFAGIGFRTAYSNFR